MKAIFLLGANFVRTQLVLIAIVLAYMICLTGFLAFHEQLPDLVFFVRQQAIYAIALGAMVMVTAIQNDRKSRRILSVLSKGVHRWQYLGGLLCGAVMITGIFCLAVALSALWLAKLAGVPPTGLGELLLMLFLASSAGASVALFCSVFLHPLLALAATGFILFFPYAAEVKGWHPPRDLFPVSAAIRAVINFTFHNVVNNSWRIGIEAIVQTILFWMAAAVIFARRDVTVAAE
jgi:hypothetical protein